MMITFITITSLAAAGAAGAASATSSSGFHVEITDTNGPIDAGQQLSVEAKITNNGADGQWQQLHLYENGEIIDREWVWLWGGQSKTVSLSWNTDETHSDVDEIRLDSYDDSDTQSVTINGPDVEPPGFVVDITETNAPVTAGDTLSVDAEVTNDGGDSQWQQLHLYDGGEVIDREWVWLWEGHTKTVSLSWNTDETDSSVDEIRLDSYDNSDSTDVTICSTDGVDSDEDGLTDCEEQIHGTDAQVADTDGDGLTDGQEVHNEMLSDADPLRQDVFVEVDYRGGEPSDIKNALNPVQDRFADAPIDNPDGTSGIDLHLVMDDQLSTDKELGIRDHTPSYRDYRESGYHVMAVDLTGAESSYASFGRGVVHANSADRNMAKTFMHEFGHSLGLGVGAYHGIDSWEVSADKYPSIMNYNYNKFQYNTGEPHDDWQFIEDGYTPTVGGGGCNPGSGGYWCPL